MLAGRAHGVGVFFFSFNFAKLERPLILALVKVVRVQAVFMPVFCSFVSKVIVAR